LRKYVVRDFSIADPNWFRREYVEANNGYDAVLILKEIPQSEYANWVIHKNEDCEDY